MKKLIVIMLFLPQFVFADVFVGGTINENTTWSPENGVYVVDSFLTIASGTTLTINSGTIVKAKKDSGGLSVDGRIIFNNIGSTSPTVFTSEFDDSWGGDTNQDATSTTPGSGDWYGLSFSPGSYGEFNNVRIYYGGGSASGLSFYSGIYNDRGTISVKDSVISSNRIFGIKNINGSVDLENTIIEYNSMGVVSDFGDTKIIDCFITNNNQEGIHITLGGFLEIRNTAFTNNNKTGVVTLDVNFKHSGNSSQDISMRGFNIYGTPFDGASIGGSDLPLIMSSGFVSVPQGVTLNIASGTVIKLDQNPEFGVVGTLNILGTKDSPVYFTSLKDDSIGGDSNGDGTATVPENSGFAGLVFVNGSFGFLENLIVRDSTHAIKNDGGNINVKNLSLNRISGPAIYQTTGNLKIENSNLTTSYAISNLGNIAIDAKNNWWGDRNGPYDTSTSTPSTVGARIDGLVDYDPWIKRDPSLPNPVLIIPGIMGSYLNNEKEEEIWMRVYTMSLPGGDSYLLDLDMSDIGMSKLDIRPGDVIREVDIPLFSSDFFEGLVEYLSNYGYVENSNLFLFPYDWRLDVGELAKKLEIKINELKETTGSEKIDIIAHSMGGLLFKRYLYDHGAEFIDNFIDIATPHNGSPRSFLTLMYGVTDIKILSSNTIKYISQNMPSVYQLLPSREYFDFLENGYYIFDGIGGSNRLDFDETKDYLKNSGRNSSLIERADQFHQELDNLDPSDYGVDTYNIVGCGTPTLGQVYILDKEDDEYKYTIKMIDGDGTVPIKSAEAVSAIKTYYVKEAKHALMPSTSGVKELVTSILKSDEDFDLSGFSNLSNSSSICGIPDGKIVSFQSPITLDIYDSQGNHVGPNENGDIENNINGVVYEVIEENKFAFLPNGVEYTVEGNSTGIGDFDVRIENVVNGEVESTRIFKDIPLTQDTEVKFLLSSKLPQEIFIDSNGDKVHEKSFAVSTSSTGFMASTGKVRVLDAEHKAFAQVHNSGSRERRSVQIIPVEKNKIQDTKKSIKLTLKNEIKKETNPTFNNVKKPNKKANAFESITINIKTIFGNLFEWFKSKL